MLNNTILDTLISLSLVLLVFSILISALVEWFNNFTWRQKRQLFLYRSIRQALEDNVSNGISWASRFYDHPLISTLKSSKKRYPVYIASSTFAEVLIDMVLQNRVDHSYIRDEGDKDKLTYKSSWHQPSYQMVTEAISELEEGKFKRLMISFLPVSGKDDSERFESFTKNIKDWFDNYQDRVSGWYKKSIRRNLFTTGLVIAVLLNIDVINIFKKVSQDEKLRASLVASAVQTAGNYQELEFDPLACENCSTGEYNELYENYIARRLRTADSLAVIYSDSNLPIGWELPKGKIAYNISILRNEIDSLREVKKDTTEGFVSRYCLIRSFVDGKAFEEDSIHKFATQLLSLEEGVSTDTIKSLYTLYGLKIAKEGLTTLQYLYLNVPIDSLASGNCFPTKQVQERYFACTADCRCINKLKSLDLIQKDLSDRIANNELEIQFYYDLEKARFWNLNIADWITRFCQINFGSYRFIDFMSLIIGASIAAFGASRGSIFWFQLLVFLLRIRRAGDKPKRGVEEEKRK